MGTDDASIDKLNAAVWAAGFAMAPTEVDAVEAVASTGQSVTAGWRSARTPAIASVARVSTQLNMRQWLANWQWRATA